MIVKFISLFFIMQVIAQLAFGQLNGDPLADLKMVDTVEGLFLCEIDAPLKCLNRLDNLGSQAIINYDSTLLKHNLEQLYRKGLYYYLDHYNRQKITLYTQLISDKQSVIELYKKLHDLTVLNDETALATAVYDGTGYLRYKKFYAKFLCVDLGMVANMIPIIDKGECTYTNEDNLIDTKYIVKVLDFNIF
ncbi:hypothetical protein [Chitinophaga sancti]|uniref:hypothetical protein n=1 Tax=Chitinophaga sancti TaxID=1004 RepID=UPI003F79C473